MKYEWIEFTAYKSWKTFVTYIEDVIINFGKNIELILSEYLSPTKLSHRSALNQLNKARVNFKHFGLQ
ncbi:hypothetical protein MEO40_27825, partial [Dolichospermum sp. ST_sed1]|nr:hypothetical protein [Dolichospermum sp. ST_sed1]